MLSALEVLMNQASIPSSKVEGHYQRSSEVG